MTINIEEGLTFDDVLLIPKFSTIKSRSEIDLSVNLSKGFKFSHPIVPANMKTITGQEMAKCIAETSGLAILHRFMSIEDQLKIVNDFVLMTNKDAVDYMSYIGVSIGVKKEDFENIQALYQLGARIFCIDIAHGDSENCVAMTKYISEKYPDVFLIAGNVATAEGAKKLWESGADCVKVNIGAGSLCTTRIETGNGVPQLTALSDVFDMRKKLSVKKPKFIIADGGCKNSGDLVKSLCFADLVMTGNLFAGVDEAPGQIIQVEDKKYKSYVGSSTHKTNHVEGVKAIVPAKGPTNNVLTKLFEGIKSGLSYQGCKNLYELKNNPRFVRITNAGLIESHPHDVKVL